MALQTKGDGFVAEVQDDGKGLDVLVNNAGNDLKNMKARAGSPDADFTIDSKEGKGTRVQIQFQFHPAGGHVQKT